MIFQSIGKIGPPPQISKFKVKFSNFEAVAGTLNFIVYKNYLNMFICEYFDTFSRVTTHVFRKKVIFAPP